MTKSTKTKVVVTNRIFPETRQFLAQCVDVEENDSAAPWSYEEVRRRCRNADGLLAFMTDRIDADFLDACPQIKVIGAALKGYDNIDADACRTRDVVITVVPDLLTVPTAELAVGLMLALGRNILAGDRRIRADGFQGWRPSLYGLGIEGTTVGLIGFGQVGRAVAERLTAFRCRLLAYDAAAARDGEATGGIVRRCALQEVLANSDYVVLALPLTAATYRLIDARLIALMKPGAMLINPARGSLVDEAAVADAIESGRLAGYAADVFECEDWAQQSRPDSIDPRLTAAHAPTILTPHLGSAVASVRRDIELSAARSILQVLSGRTPENAIN